MKESKCLIFVLSLLVGVHLFSCSPVKQEEHESSDMGNEANSQSESEEEHSNHDMDHEGVSMQMSEDGSTTWRPTGDGPSLITRDFHFLSGALENINPELIQDSEDNNILKLTLDGETTAFVFHQTYGNVGMAAILNKEGFDGTIKLIHHAIDVENYEFVSITGSRMKLGRIVNGVENIFNEEKYENDSDWIDLRVSAAGTHFKGYIGSKTITHGHGDKMKDGYIGLMLIGSGTIQIKSIELAKLEDE